MRALTAAQSVAINGATAGTSGLTGSPAFHMRVQVKDSGGTFRDLTTYPGVNMVKSAEWSESTDEPGAHATVTLLREQDSLSLAPLMQASPLNVAFTPGGSYAALVFVGRRIRIDIAVVPGDSSPAAGDWAEHFTGYIDSVEAASGDTMVLECRDMMAAVTDAYIEEERIYLQGRDGTTRCGCRTWEPGRTYAVGEYVLASPGKRDAAPYIYKATSISGTGTSGAAEPTWPTTLTNTVTDNAGANQIVWTCTVAISTSGSAEAIEDVIQAILNNNMASPPTLSTLDGSMSWSLGGLLSIPRGSLAQAVQGLVNQAGWDLRWRWSSGGGAYVLSTQKFTRSGASVNYTFGPGDYLQVGSAKIDNSTIRNVVRVIYTDASDLDGNKTPQRHVYEASDSSSITKYGRRFMEISESFVSTIDSASEAQTLAEACRDDLKEPTMELAVDLALGFPWAEVGDTYSFTTNSRHWSATQTLALWGYRHRAENGQLHTTLTCRGSPGLGPELWGRIEGRVNAKHSLTPAMATTGFELAASPTVGGARITLATSDAVSGYMADPKAFPPDFEVHLSTSSSFTPSASTLKAVMQGNSLEVSELTPGATYYYKAVPRVRNAGRLTRGLPSTEKSFTAGKAQSIHIAPEVSPGLFPYNGAFEHVTRNINSFPPDNWEMQAGTWGSTGDAYDGSDANGGEAIVLRQTATNPQVRSSLFPVQYGATYTLQCIYKTSGANAGSKSFDIKVYFFKDTAGTASSTASRTHSVTNASAGAWLSYSVSQQTVPSDANFARVELTKSGAASDYQIEVDSVWLYRDNAFSLVNEAWNTPGSMLNSWVNYDTSNWASCQYFIDANGLVHLKGLIKSGTLNANAFQLPTAYRPYRSHTFPVVTAGGFGHVDVLSTGYVLIGADCSATWTSLCGIIFRYDAA